MGDAKLEKINKRLYHEPYKDGRPFKWAKHLQFLSVKLTDIRVGLDLSVERPETSMSLLFALDDTDSEEETNKNKATGGDDEATEKYSETFGWRITAVGLLDDRRIGLIKEDGTRTTYGEDLDRVDVTLRPIAEDHKEKAVGTLFCNDDEILKWQYRSESYVTLLLQVPEFSLEKLCREIVEGRLSELHLGVYVDVFQSEVERSLAEPGTRLEYYIEEDSSFNQVYLSSISAYQAVGNGNRAGDAYESEGNIANLEPTSGRGWRRLCFIGALLWIPLTVLLSALNIFGSYGSNNALLFWFSGTIILIVLGFACPWIVRGFERKAKDKE